MTEESEMSTEVTIYLKDKGVGNVLWEIESQEIFGTGKGIATSLYSRVSQSAYDALSVQ